MDDIIIHTRQENDMAARLMNDHKDSEYMANFGEEVANVPPEIMDKYICRLYEEGILKRMTEIMNEIYREEAENTQDG